MKELHAWLDREARRSARRPSLEEALLTDRAAGYFRYRLRYVGVRVGLRTLLHLAEIALFAQVIWPEFLVYFLIVRSACALFSTLYWGALEQMREEVRHWAQARRWSSVRGVIDRWLWLAVVCVLLQFGGLALFMRHGPTPFDSFSILDVYAMACVGRLACETLARTYHSGIFALRRVHRPLPSLLLPDVLDVVSLLWLWPWLGAWSFGPVLFGVGLLRSGLSVRYATAGYRASRIPPLRVKRLARSLRQLRGVTLGPAARHGLANVTAQLDSLLILALVAGSAERVEALGMAALFYVLRPLMSAGFAWSRLFYFDLKRLTKHFGRLMRVRFERLLRRLSLVMAAGLALLVWGLVPVFGFAIDRASLAMMVPFLGLRSLFALQQVQAFAYGRHDVLLRATLVLVAGLLGVSVWNPGTAMLLGASSATLAAAVLIGGAATLRARRESDTPAIVGMPRFLCTLTAARESVQLWVGRVDRHLTHTHRVALALVADPAVVCVARWGRTQLLWMTRGSEPDSVLRARLLRATGGCLRELNHGRFAADGPSALALALSEGLWDPALVAMLVGAPQYADTDALVHAFRSAFANGMCIDARGRLHTFGSRRLSRAVVQRILTQLRRLANGEPLRTLRRPDVDVVVYGPGGEAQLIFVMAHTAPQAARLAWRRKIVSATLQASMLASVSPSVAGHDGLLSPIIHRGTGGIE